MENLIERLQGRDRRAFEYLYDNYSPALYGTIKRIIRDDEVAQDLLQDTFVKIWANIGQYDDSKGRLFTWMINIARRTAIDYLRVRKLGIRIANCSVNESLENMLMDDFQQTLFNQEWAHLFVSPAFSVDSIGVRFLPNLIDADYAQIIELIYFDDLSHEEAAKRLKMPLGTLKTRVRAALRQLRTALIGDLAAVA